MGKVWNRSGTKSALFWSEIESGFRDLTGKELTFFLGVMLLKIACTRHVLANIAPNARVKPMDIIQARALKGRKEGGTHELSPSNNIK